MSHQWFRVTKSHPCIVCKHDSWCCIGQHHALCMRTESERPIQFKSGETGWLHPLDGDYAPPKPTRKDTDRPNLNVMNLLEGWYSDPSFPTMDLLANSLGVSVQSLALLGCVWAKPHHAWAFPMRNGDGGYVGIRLRSPDGKKWAVKGSKQGIFLPHGDPKKTALICEGPTDTASAITLGYYAIGRPSCSGGLFDILLALRRMNVSRVIIVGDNDDPGLQGAETLQRHLTVPSTVVILPCKDMRESVRCGLTKLVLDNMISKLKWTQPEINPSNDRS